MKLFNRAIKQLDGLKRQGMDLASLQLRLTLGMTTLALLGVGSIGSWTTWEMRQMLIVDHQRYLQSIGDRIPAELRANQSTQPVTAQIQALIDRESSPDLWMWVKGTHNQVLATSHNLSSFPGEAALLPQAMMPLQPKVSAVNGHYLVLLSQPLQLNGKAIGQIYLAQDITHDYTVLNTLVNSLRFATILAVAVLATLIAYLIWRSLHPLRKMNQMAIAQGKLPPQGLELDEIPSELRGLVQAFGSLSSRLTEADEQQRQFTNSISHEIRTSLSLVYGYLQSMLRRCNNLTDSQKAALEVAVEETERTIQLLKDLLDLARINGETMEFHLEPIVLNDWVATAVEMVQSPETAIELQASAPLIVAQADSSQLIRILKHLLDNAVRYAQPRQPIVIKLSETSDSAVIQVYDRGCGISLKDQAHIFEPFYRVDASRCRSTGGIGLGLAIAKSLVEGMNGQITVQSELGQGSIFTVKLPLGCADEVDVAAGKRAIDSLPSSDSPFSQTRRIL
ncbi:MAG TPA: HAMP domain-containing sensor histidine kinase [Coleofasciculaceae cyanobacterium]